MTKNRKNQGGIILKKHSKIIGLLLAVALLLPGMATKVSAADMAVKRLAGLGRVETSIAVSNEVYTKSETVVLAGYLGEVDALTGTLLAGAMDAPLLLTKQAKLEDQVKEELVSLGAKNVYLLGGETVISEEVETELEDLDYTVTRVSGLTREETAANVAKEVNAKATHVFLAQGWDVLADALAAGPVSAMKEMPVLLTKTDRIPEATMTAMDDLGVTHVTLLGKESAISKDVEDYLVGKDLVVNRIGGAAREDTAAEIAAEYFADSKNAIVASGYTYADALVGGYLGAAKNAPILLTNVNTTKTATTNFLTANAEMVYVLGGETVVSEKVFNEITDIIADKKELSVESVSAIDATTLEVTLSDDTVHEVTLEKSLKPNVATKVTFTIGENDYTETVTWVVSEDTEFPAEPDVAGMKAELKELEVEEAELLAEWTEADNDAAYYHAIYLAEEAKGNETAAKIAKDKRDEAIAERTRINDEVAKVEKEIDDQKYAIKAAEKELAAIKATKKAAESKKQIDISAATEEIKKVEDKDVRDQLTEINQKTYAIKVALELVETQMGYLPELKDIDSTNDTQKANIANVKKAINDAKALDPNLDFSKEETQIKKLETAMDNHAEAVKENKATAKVVSAEAFLEANNMEKALRDHDAAVELVKDLKDGKVKTDLTARLMEVQKGIEEVQADRKAAADVDKMIAAIKFGDKITPDNVKEVKVEVEAARTAFDALTEEQQKLVKHEGPLKSRETRVKFVEDWVADQEKAAKPVIDLIEALPSEDTKYGDLTNAQVAKIEEANAALGGLTKDEMSYVTNFAKLDKLVKTVNAGK